MARGVVSPLPDDVRGLAPLPFSIEAGAWPAVAGVFGFPPNWARLSHFSCFRRVIPYSEYKWFMPRHKGAEGGVPRYKYYLTGMEPGTGDFVYRKARATQDGAALQMLTPDVQPDVNANRNREVGDPGQDATVQLRALTASPLLRRAWHPGSPPEGDEDAVHHFYATAPGRLVLEAAARLLKPDVWPPVNGQWPTDEPTLFPSPKDAKKLPFQVDLRIDWVACRTGLDRADQVLPFLAARPVRGVKLREEDVERWLFSSGRSSSNKASPVKRTSGALYDEIQRVAANAHQVSEWSAALHGVLSMHADARRELPYAVPGYYHNVHRKKDGSAALHQTRVSGWRCEVCCADGAKSLIMHERVMNAASRGKPFGDWPLVVNGRRVPFDCSAYQQLLMGWEEEAYAAMWYALAEERTLTGSPWANYFASELKDNAWLFPFRIHPIIFQPRRAVDIIELAAVYRHEDYKQLEGVFGQETQKWLERWLTRSLSRYLDLLAAERGQAVPVKAGLDVCQVVVPISTSADKAAKWWLSEFSKPKERMYGPAAPGFALSVGPVLQATTQDELEQYLWDLPSDPESPHGVPGAHADWFSQHWKELSFVLRGRIKHQETGTAVAANRGLFPRVGNAMPIVRNPDNGPDARDWLQLMPIPVGAHVCRARGYVIHEEQA